MYWFVLVIFLLGTAAVLVIRWTVQRRSVEGMNGCGRCGYLVTGLPSNICPECGSDLKVVGVRGPHPWMRLLPSARRNILLVVWTLWYAGAVMVLWPLLGLRLAPCLVMESDSSFLAPADGKVTIEYVTGYWGEFWPSEVERSGVQFDRFDDGISGWSLRITRQATSQPTPPDQALNLDAGPIGSSTEKRFCVDLENKVYAFDDPVGLGRTRRSGAWEDDFVAWMQQMAKQFNCPGLATDMQLGRRWPCMGDMPYRSSELPGEGGFFTAPQMGQYINMTGMAGLNRYQRTDWRLLGGELAAVLTGWAAGIVYILHRSRRSQTKSQPTATVSPPECG